MSNHMINLYGYKFQCMKIQCTAVRNRTIQYTAVRNRTIQYTAVRNRTIQYTVVRNRTIQYTAVRNRTIQGTAVRNSTIQGTAVRNRRIQRTEQYSAVQCSAVQYSTVKFIMTVTLWLWIKEIHTKRKKLKSHYAATDLIWSQTLLFLQSHCYSCCYHYCSFQN